MRYEVWAIQWYSELDRAVCVGCAESITAASDIIRNYGAYRDDVHKARFHFDVRVRAA